jgi:hypothetical protein
MNAVGRLLLSVEGLAAIEAVAKEHHYKAALHHGMSQLRAGFVPLTLLCPPHLEAAACQSMPTQRLKPAALHRGMRPLRLESASPTINSYQEAPVISYQYHQLTIIAHLVPDLRLFGTLQSSPRAKSTSSSSETPA